MSFHSRTLRWDQWQAAGWRRRRRVEKVLKTYGLMSATRRRRWGRGAAAAVGDGDRSGSCSWCVAGQDSRKGTAWHLQGWSELGKRDPAAQFQPPQTLSRRLLFRQRAISLALVLCLQSIRAILSHCPLLQCIGRVYDTAALVPTAGPLSFGQAACSYDGSYSCSPRAPRGESMESMTAWK